MKTVTVPTDVTVDVDLGDFSNSELLEELQDRASKGIKVSIAGEIITVLERLGCPRSIIDDLNEWDSAPIADKRRLIEWQLSCQATPL